MAMLLLLAVSLLDLTTGVTTGPSGALNLWRTGRLTQWSRVLDRRFDREYRAFGKVRPDLRYRTQILVVDGEGVRARICEAVLDRLCEDVDADVDAASSSMTLSHESRRPTTALSDTLSAVGLSPLSLKAGARNLQPNDLLLGSRWDLIVCTDLNVLERVRALTRAANAIDRAGGSVRGDDWGDDGSTYLQWSSHPSGQDTDKSVLCITDFLADGVPEAASTRLPAELRRLVAPLEELGDASLPVELIDRSLVDVPELDAQDEQAREAVDDIVGAVTICCVQLIAYLEALIREHATRSFRDDLVTSCATVARDSGGLARDVTWEQAQSAMRSEHRVNGGLDDDERRRIFDDYLAVLRAGATGGGRGVRVDVSDLGLSMDDLSGPFGSVS